ncbi:MAG TPA: AMP-binding protein, partial [Armatimonadota bacterium]
CAEPSHAYVRLADLLAEGRRLRSSGDRLAEERAAGIRPEDLFTLIYTSGTTGIPKGVMLTHQSMISQVRLVPITVTPRDRAIAILPIWHILERVYEMILIAGGACAYYSSIRTLKEDFAEVRPTLMVSAPRLWESVYQGILAHVKKQPPVRQALFSAAYYSARKVQTARRYLAGRRLKLTCPPAHRVWLGGLWHGVVLAAFLVPYLALDPLVLRKLRAALGGQLQSTLSGGGALPRQVDEFFNNIGIPVQEGYGLTETCPVLSVRTGRGMVIGTVGPLIPQTELRLLDLETREVIYPPRRGVMGEVHVRGPQVMEGYYKDPEGTARVLSDGWLNTGDLGIVTHNGCLRIVGRSKDTIVLLGGENVEPAPIENTLRESPLIDQCMVVGQDRKTLGALVIPRQSALQAYGEDLEALAQSEEARQAVMRDIRRLVSRANGFKGFELVTNCRLLPKPFEVGDELTNLFKLRRQVVAEKYAAEIRSLYQ